MGLNGRVYFDLDILVYTFMIYTVVHVKVTLDHVAATLTTVANRSLNFNASFNFFDTTIQFL